MTAPTFCLKAHSRNGAVQRCGVPAEKSDFNEMSRQKSKFKVAREDAIYRKGRNVGKNGIAKKPWKSSEFVLSSWRNNKQYTVLTHKFRHLSETSEPQFRCET